MIEDKIDKLIEAIENLTETISNNTKPKDTKKEKPAEEPAAKKEEAKPAETVTIDELQDLCLKLVRRDKKNKDKIIKIIADHGGELLKDIDETKLPDVKKALEAI